MEKVGRTVGPGQIETAPVLDPATLEAAAKVARETGLAHAEGWGRSGPAEAHVAASNATYFIEKAIRALAQT